MIEILTFPDKERFSKNEFFLFNLEIAIKMQNENIEVSAYSDANLDVILSYLLKGIRSIQQQISFYIWHEYQ